MSIVVNGSEVQKIMIDTPDNLTASECWKAYRGDNIIYDKSKTVENCWKEYGYLNGQTLRVSDDIIELPEVIDWRDYVNVIKWNQKISNIDFYDEVIDYYSNNVYSSTQGSFNRIFNNSNVRGELTLNFTGTDHNYVNYPIGNTGITKLIFNFEDDSNISVMNDLFHNAKQLTSIETNKPFGGKDLSGAFSQTPNLRSIPEGCIDWSWRAEDDDGIFRNHIQYAFEVSALTEIPLFDSSKDRDDNVNTIIVAPHCRQAFNSANGLTKISPCLDMTYVIPDDNGNTYLLFRAFGLRDAHIKNLGNGTWYLDGEGAHHYLNRLNEESVIYLFDNLQENISGTNYGLYCPESWRSYITNEMYQSASAKGWDIYINNVLYVPEEQ